MTTLKTVLKMIPSNEWIEIYKNNCACVFDGTKRELLNSQEYQDFANKKILRIENSLDNNISITLKYYNEGI